MKSPLFNTLFKSTGAAGPSNDAVASSAARTAALLASRARGCRFLAELSGATAPEPRALQRHSCEGRGGRYIDVAVTPCPGSTRSDGSWGWGKAKPFFVFFSRDH